MATKLTDLDKIRVLLNVVVVDGGSVTLSGESAALVAAAITENEQLRSELIVVKQALRDVGEYVRGEHAAAFEAWLFSDGPGGGWVPEPDRKPSLQKRGVNPAISAGPPPVQLRITPAGLWRPNAPGWPDSPRVPQVEEVEE